MNQKETKLPGSAGALSDDTLEQVSGGGGEFVPPEMDRGSAPPYGRWRCVNGDWVVNDYYDKQPSKCPNCGGDQFYFINVTVRR